MVCRAQFAARSAPRESRCRVVLPDEAGTGAVCSRDARACDLGHVDPYDEDRPPGQTRPENLASS